MRLPVLFACLLSCGWSGLAPSVFAQTYPSRPLRLILSFPGSIEPPTNTPQEFASFIQAWTACYAKVIKSADIKVD